MFRNNIYNCVDELCVDQSFSYAQIHMPNQLDFVARGPIMQAWGLRAPIVDLVLLNGRVFGPGKKFNLDNLVLIAGPSLSLSPNT
jgi:hypothetical protein